MKNRWSYEYSNYNFNKIIDSHIHYIITFITMLYKKVSNYVYCIYLNYKCFNISGIKRKVLSPYDSCRPT